MALARLDILYRATVVCSSSGDSNAPHENYKDENNKKNDADKSGDGNEGQKKDKRGVVPFFGMTIK